MKKIVRFFRGIKNAFLFAFAFKKTIPKEERPYLKAITFIAVVLGLCSLVAIFIIINIFACPLCGAER